MSQCQGWWCLEPGRTRQDETGCNASSIPRAVAVCPPCSRIMGLIGFQAGNRDEMETEGGSGWVRMCGGVDSLSWQRVEACKRCNG